jgi:hypothetical protein
MADAILLLAIVGTLLGLIVRFGIWWLEQD